MARQRGGAGEGDVDVLLEDDDEPWPGRTGGEPGRGTADDRRGAPRARRRVVAVVVAALVVVAAANAAQIWQERTAYAALAGTPGFVPRMPVAPEIVWSLPQGHVTGASDTLLLVAGSSGATSAVEAATGATLWSGDDVHPDGGWSDCRFVREGRVVELDLWALTQQETVARSVVCAHRTTAGASTESVLQVLDARTGRVRSERTVPGDPVVLDSVDGDVVHGERDAAGRVQLVRWDPEADVDVWKQRLGAGRAGSGGDVWAALLGDRLLVQDADGAHLRSLEDGEVITDDDGAGVLRVAVLADGATVGLDLTDAGTSPLVVTEADGSERLRLEQWFAGPRTLDPRTPAVLVRTGGGALSAHDVRDGTLLWTRSGDGRSPTSSWSGSQDTPLALVAHRLVLAAGDGGLEAVDARDGASLWTSEDLTAWVPGAVSDGRSVVVPALRGDPAEADAEPVLVAVDLADGSEVWGVRLPAPGYAVHDVGELLVVQTESGLVALRP